MWFLFWQKLIWTLSRQAMMNSCSIRRSSSVRATGGYSTRSVITCSVVLGLHPMVGKSLTTFSPFTAWRKVSTILSLFLLFVVCCLHVCCLFVCLFVCLWIHACITSSVSHFWNLKKVLPTRIRLQIDSICGLILGLNLYLLKARLFHNCQYIFWHLTWGWFFVKWSLSLLPFCNCTLEILNSLEGLKKLPPNFCKEHLYQNFFLNTNLSFSSFFFFLGASVRQSSIQKCKDWFPVSFHSLKS